MPVSYHAHDELNPFFLIPAPFVSINKSFDKTGAGETLGVRYGITITGHILPTMGSPIAACDGSHDCGGLNELGHCYGCMSPDSSIQSYDSESNCTEVGECRRDASKSESVASTTVNNEAQGTCLSYCDAGAYDEADCKGICTSPAGPVYPLFPNQAACEERGLCSRTYLEDQEAKTEAHCTSGGTCSHTRHGLIQTSEDDCLSVGVCSDTDYTNKTTCEDEEGSWTVLGVWAENTWAANAWTPRGWVAASWSPNAWFRECTKETEAKCTGNYTWIDQDIGSAKKIDGGFWKTEDKDYRLNCLGDPYYRLQRKQAMIANLFSKRNEGGELMFSSPGPAGNTGLKCYPRITSIDFPQHNPGQPNLSTYTVQMEADHLIDAKIDGKKTDDDWHHHSKWLVSSANETWDIQEQDGTFYTRGEILDSDGDPITATKDDADLKTGSGSNTDTASKDALDQTTSGYRDFADEELSRIEKTFVLTHSVSATGKNKFARDSENPTALGGSTAADGFIDPYSASDNKFWNKYAGGCVNPIYTTQSVCEANEGTNSWKPNVGKAWRQARGFVYDCLHYGFRPFMAGDDKVRETINPYADGETAADVKCVSAPKCSNTAYVTQGSCEAAGTCSDAAYGSSQSACTGAGKTWTSAGNTWTVSATLDADTKSECIQAGGIWAHSPNDDMDAFGLNIPDNYTSYNYVRTQNIDEMGGSFSATETWLLVPTNAIALETAECNISEGSDVATAEVSFSGTITGIVQDINVDEDNDENLNDFDNTQPYDTGDAYLDSDELTMPDSVTARDPKNSKRKTGSSYNIEDDDKTTHIPSKYENALKYFHEKVNPSAHKTAQYFANDSKGYRNITLNPIPTSKSIAQNPNTGVITYNYTFNNRKLNAIPYVKAENISVNETIPGRVAAETPVIGRKYGPVLQDIGTQTKWERSLSIDCVVDVVNQYHCKDTTNQIIAPYNNKADCEAAGHHWFYNYNHVNRYFANTNEAKPTYNHMAKTGDTVGLPYGQSGEGDPYYLADGGGNPTHTWNNMSSKHVAQRDGIRTIIDNFSPGKGKGTWEAPGPKPKKKDNPKHVTKWFVNPSPAESWNPQTGAWSYSISWTYELDIPHNAPFADSEIGNPHEDAQYASVRFDGRIPSE